MRSKLLIGVLCFGITLLIFFPYYGIRNRLFNEVSQKTGLEIFAGNMLPTFLGMGVSMKDVTVQLPARALDGRNVDVEFRRVKAYVPWTSLLAFSPSVEVEGQLATQGALDLTLRPKGKEMTIRATFKDIDAASYISQLGLTEVNVSGMVTLSLDTVVDVQAQTVGKTQFTLEIKKVSLGAFEIAGFSIPSLAFVSPAQIKGDAKDGKTFEVTLGLGQVGDPFILSTEGSVTLDIKRFSESNFLLKNAITLSPDFMQNETVSMVLPLLDQFKKEAALYHIKLTGTVGKGVDIPTPF